MSLATGIRSTVRNYIASLGNTATLFPFSSATKSYNDEGDLSVTNWGTGTSIKAISANDYKLRRILSMQGEESNNSDKVLFVRDDVTLAAKDRVTLGSDVYEIDEIKAISPIQDTNLAYRVVLVQNVNY